MLLLFCGDNIDQSDKLYQRSIALYEAGDFEGSIDVLRTVIDKDLSYEKAYRRIAVICHETDSLNLAENYFQHLTAQNPLEPIPLYGLGLVDLYCDQPDLAITHFKKALELSPRCFTPYGELAKSYDRAGRFDEGLVYFQQLVDSLEGNGLAMLGLAYMAKAAGRYEDSYAYAESSLVLDSAILDIYPLKIELENILGRPRDALATAETGLRLARKSHRNYDEMMSLGGIAKAHWSQGDFAISIRHYEKALELAVKLGEKKYQSFWLNNIGAEYRSLGELDKALEYLNRSLEIDRKFRDKIGEEIALSNIGDVYIELGQFEKALEFQQASLAMARGRSDWEGTAITLGGIGATYGYMGKFAESFQATREALAINRRFGLKLGESFNLGNIGINYLELGDYGMALALLDSAMILSEEIGDNSNAAKWALAISSTYYSLSDKEQALTYGLQAVALAEETGETIMLGDCYGNLGLIALAADNPLEAQKYFQKSLLLLSEAGAKREVACALSALASLRAHETPDDSAVALAEKAQVINQEISCPFGEAQTLCDLGFIYVQKNDYTQAIKSFNAALRIAQQSAMDRITWYAYFGLGMAYENQGKNLEALSSYRSAANTIEAMRSGLITEPLRISFFEDKQKVYERAIRLSLDTAAQSHEKSLELAFEYIERARARAFLDLLSESMIDIRKGIDTALAHEETRIIRNISGIQTSLAFAEGDKNAVTRLVAELNENEKLLDKLSVQIRTSSKQYAALKQPQIETIGLIQTSILKDDEILLEYFLGDSASYVLAISKSECEAYRLPPESEIASSMKIYLEAIGKPPSGSGMDEDIGGILYDILVAPVQASLKSSSRLIVVPDGILNYLPFETLVTGIKNGKPQFLIQSHEVRYAPSATVLALLEGQRKRRPPHKRNRVLVLANPIPSKADYLADAGLTRGSYFYGRMDLSPLPYAAEEALGIRASFSEGQTMVMLGNQAAEETIKSIDLADFEMIHFATHALIDEAVPRRSCIVLARSEDSGEDGFLQLNEIFNLRLNADLVTLSGCRTAGGKLVGGEGVIGLSRGFFYAGTNSLILSLWPVNDQAASQFMQIFYRRLKEGEDKAGALRAAKLAFLAGNSPPLRHPYYWAPYILMGAN